MNTIPTQSHQSFYLKHKGLIINLFSVLTFLGFNYSLSGGGVNDLEKQPWMALLFIIIFFLEPWATYYSMGAFNQRRETAGIRPVLLHRSLGLGFLGIVFWGGRIALLGVLFVSSVQTIGLPAVLENNVTVAVVWISLMVREGFIVYYMASKKPLPHFKESKDLLADIILMVVLAFGQLIVGEVYRDMGAKGLGSITDFFYFLFPIMLFFFVFYLPIRCIYTIEDFTFARTKWEKAEQVLSFLVVFIAFLIAR